MFEPDIEIASSGRVNRTLGCMELSVTKFPMATRIVAMLDDVRAVVRQSTARQNDAGLALDMQKWRMPEGLPHPTNPDLCVFRFYTPQSMNMLRLQLEVAGGFLRVARQFPQQRIVGMQQIRRQHELQMIDCLLKTVRQLLSEHTTFNEEDALRARTPNHGAA